MSGMVNCIVKSDAEEITASRRRTIKGEELPMIWRANALIFIFYNTQKFHLSFEILFGANE